MGQAEIARLLGVSRGQVHMWAQRRATSGFPSPVERETPSTRPQYDVDAVVDWYSKWDPNKNRGAHWSKKRKGKTTVRRKHG